MPKKVGKAEGYFVVLGILVFMVVMCHLFSQLTGVEFAEAVSNPERHMNILALSVLAGMAGLLAYAGLIHGEWPRPLAVLRALRDRDVPLGYKLNVIALLAEIILFFYFWLRGYLIYWILGLMMAQVGLLFTRYRDVIVKIQKEEWGADRSLITIRQDLDAVIGKTDDVFGLARGVGVYYLVIPLLSVLELIVGLRVYTSLLHGNVIFLILLVLGIGVQDILLFLLFFLWDVTRRRSRP